MGRTPSGKNIATSVDGQSIILNDMRKKRQKKQQQQQRHKAETRLEYLFSVQGLEESVCSFLHAADLARLGTICSEFSRLVAGPALLSVWQCQLTQFWTLLHPNWCSNHRSGAVHNQSVDQNDEHPKNIIGAFLADVPGEVAEAKEEADAINYPGISDNDWTVVEPYFNIGDECCVAWSHLQSFFYGTHASQDLYTLYATPSWK
jgi:hypothetical protein